MGYLQKNLACIILAFLCPGAICAADLDKNKYIGISEIKAGMKGYCLTCMQGTEVKRYELEVLSVIHNLNPSSDTILVKCLGPEFEHAGMIAGCSGSPVYLDGRLAGAMAFGWTGSKDPIYGVTLIEDMLRTGSSESYKKLQASQSSEVSLDFSKPINFSDVENQFRTFLNSKKNSFNGFSPLPTPVLVSGLPASSLNELNSVFEPLSLTAIGGAGSSANIKGKIDSSSSEKSAKLAPGTSLVVPLVYGDVVLSASGTVTEVIGDTVYGFGHSLLGYGPVDLPMATGQVHTVIANQDRSFKLISPLKVVGALKADESSAIMGKIGAQAPMFDMTITVNRYNDTQTRVFKCKVINHKTLTPTLISTIIGGTATFLGDLPPQHNVKYQVTLSPEDSKLIVFENTSGTNGVAELSSDVSNAIRLFMNNPFKSVMMKSIDIKIEIAPKDISSRIWSVEVSNTKVKAGDSIDVSVVLESVRESKRNYNFQIIVPQNLPNGNYVLAVCGTAEYVRFLNQAAPYRFVVQNFNDLDLALKELLSIERDRLHCFMILPPAGIVLEKSELSDLPPTKASVLFDSRRTLVSQPYQNWIDSSLKTGLLTSDRKNIQITVEN
jgi:hypothetical protein